MQTFITSIGQATPKHKFKQSDIANFMARSLAMDEQETKRLKILYRATDIEYRYSLISDYDKFPDKFDFFPANESLTPFPSTSKRMQLYLEEGFKVMLQAANNCLEKHPSVSSKDITHLIIVSCTGMYAPGPDIQLIEALGLPTDTKRTAINFMGCYAAFNAIKAAKSFVASVPDAKALVVCAEFCSLHFQKSKEDDHLLSGALFGDGAAAVLLESEPNGNLNLSLESEQCDLWLDGGKNMAWKIGDFGFEMRLSAYVPELINQGIKGLTEKLLIKHNLSPEDIDYFAIHPGGKKIIEKVEEALNIPRQKSCAAHKVLKEYGNMSSPTILFVLNEILENIETVQDSNKYIMAFAFGPGLTLESILFKIS